MYTLTLTDEEMRRIVIWAEAERAPYCWGTETVESIKAKVSQAYSHGPTTQAEKTGQAR